MSETKKLVLVHPQNSAMTATDSSMAARLATLQGMRVGLLDNSKNKAGRMLDAIADILDRQYGFRMIVRQRKPSASKPADPQMIAELKQTCDMAIVGVGD